MVCYSLSERGKKEEHTNNHTVSESRDTVYNDGFLCESNMRKRKREKMVFSLFMVLSVLSITDSYFW
jgi:hypothetical protein